MNRDLHLPFFAPKKTVRKAVREALAIKLHTRQMKLHDCFVSPRNKLHFTHGNSWKQGSNQDQPTTMKAHTAEASIHFKDLKEHRISAISDVMNTLDQALGDQFQTAMVQTVDHACTSSGQMVDARSMPFHEALLLAFEKMELSVDNTGELELPVMLAGDPEIAAQKLRDAPEEFHAKFEALKKRKLEEAVQREASRKAKFKRPPE